MNSLVSTTNEDQFMALLAQADPEMWRTRMVLNETRVNPVFLPKIIRSIYNVVSGEGYGSVHIEIKKREIKKIQSREDTKVDLPVFED